MSLYSITQSRFYGGCEHNGGNSLENIRQWEAKVSDEPGCRIVNSNTEIWPLGSYVLDIENKNFLEACLATNAWVLL